MTAKIKNSPHFVPSINDRKRKYKYPFIIITPVSMCINYYQMALKLIIFFLLTGKPTL